MANSVKAIIVGLLAAVTGIVFILLPGGFSLEENLDLRLLFALRGPLLPPSDVVVVSIDKAASELLNLPNDPRKWPRTLHADLIRKLKEQGAAVIAFDLFFEDPRPGDEDAKLAAAIAEAGTVVLCQRLTGEELEAGADGRSRNGPYLEKTILPLPALAGAAAAVVPFPLPKLPLRLGQSWSFKSGNGETPTLPAVVFQLASLSAYQEFITLLSQTVPGVTASLPSTAQSLLVSGRIPDVMRQIRGCFARTPGLAERLLAQVRDGDRVTRFPQLIPLISFYRDDNRYLNFYGPPRSITTIPYDQALHGSRDLRNKVVLIGVSEIQTAEQRDVFPTVFSRSDGLDISGVEVAATAIANAMSDRPLRQTPFAPRIILLAVWGTVLGLTCRLLRPLPGVLFTALLCSLYLLLSWYLFKSRGVWLPVTSPLLVEAPIAFAAAFIWHFTDSQRERADIRRAFSHYLPAEVVDQVTRNLADLKADNREVYGICLYTDAEHYTALSERLSPKELADFMNRYFAAVFQPVKEHQGVISNIIGDAVLAFWVATGDEADLHLKACEAALAVSRSVATFNAAVGADMQLPIRIGLHAGRILIGNFGAADHYEYRPVGDIVNTATRLEGLNKLVGTRILASGEVMKDLKGIPARCLGDFLFVGKSQPLAVYAPGMDENSTFDAGLEAFRSGRWREAEAFFALAAAANDGPSRYYRSLCQSFLHEPPQEPWSGVIRLQSK